MAHDFGYRDILQARIMHFTQRVLVPYKYCYGRLLGLLLCATALRVVLETASKGYIRSTCSMLPLEVHVTLAKILQVSSCYSIARRAISATAYDWALSIT